jgi:MscS family membrane protein
MLFNEFMNQMFFGNPLSSYCWFLGIILVGLVFKKLLSKLLTKLLYKLLKKYTGGVGVNAFLGLLTKPLGVLLMLITLYLAFDRLEFPAHWNLVPSKEIGFRMIIFRSFQTSIIFTITWIMLRIVDFFSLVLTYRASLTHSKSDDQLIHFIKEAAKIIISILSVIFVLGTVFNLNIATLVAGLGIGGLAVALAAKESIENLLGSFTIFFDKPFTLGDLVQVGNITGNVEKIGFRSTRIRTLEKSFVTVPNKKMVDAELNNLTLRTQRRAFFNINLTYDTTSEQIKSITTEINTLLQSHPDLDYAESKAHFLNITNAGFEINITYYVNSPESNTFLITKEFINFKIIEIVNKNGSRLADSSIYAQKTS